LAIAVRADAFDQDFFTIELYDYAFIALRTPQADADRSFHFALLPLSQPGLPQFILQRRQITVTLAQVGDGFLPLVTSLRGAEQIAGAAQMYGGCGVVFPALLAD
jgi:hypothetical protein